MGGRGVATEPQRTFSRSAAFAGGFLTLVQASTSTPGAPESLAEVTALLQAAVAAPDNALASFTPAVGFGDPGYRNAVPLVCVSSPWEGALWIQSPEHVWTHERGLKKEVQLFSGRPRALGIQRAWDLPHPPLGIPAWRARPDGIELEAPLEGGLTVRFEVRVGDRMFEIRVGITNASAGPLANTRAQICSAFGEMESLGLQDPDTVTFFSEGRALGWRAGGLDYDWMESERDPVSCRWKRPRYLMAWTRESPEQRTAQDTPELRVLRRPLDAPIVAKSTLDGRRHVVFYSPWARAVMFNVYGPCCHTDPQWRSIENGETRWTTVYGFFFEGDVAPLLARLAAAHELLRTDRGLER